MLGGINFKLEAQYQECQTREIAQISYALNSAENLLSGLPPNKGIQGKLGNFRFFQLKSGRKERFFKKIKAKSGKF